MHTTPLRATPRKHPFRAAAASAGIPNLLDKLSRPAVPDVKLVDIARVEQKDATLSGMTRSLHRRLTALNLPMTARAAQAA